LSRSFVYPAHAQNTVSCISHTLKQKVQTENGLVMKVYSNS